MNRVERSRLLCFNTSPSSVSETDGEGGIYNHTTLNGVDILCLLHLRPYKPSFSNYSIYIILKNRVDKVDRKYRDIFDNVCWGGRGGNASTLSTPFFSVRYTVQILNGYTKSPKWSRHRVSTLPSTLCFLSTPFDSQETIYYKLKGGI